MSYYKDAIPVSSTQETVNKPFSRVTTITTQPGYETELLKTHKLTKKTVPDQSLNLANDFNEVGTLHQDNVYVDSVNSLIQGKDDQYKDTVIRATRDLTGYVTNQLKPLGNREERVIDRKRGLDGRFYFWEKGVDR